MKLFVTAFAALAMAAVPALAQQATVPPSQSPAPPAPARTGGAAPTGELAGAGLGSMTPVAIAGAVAFAGLGIWALSNGGSDGATSTTSTTGTR